MVADGVVAVAGKVDRVGRCGIAVVAGSEGVVGFDFGIHVLIVLREVVVSISAQHTYTRDQSSVLHTTTGPIQHERTVSGLGLTISHRPHSVLI